MVAHFAIGYVIDDKFFLLTDGKPANYLVCFSAYGSRSLKPHEICTKPDILLVGGVEVAFGKADVMYGIQDIGFAYSVAAYEAVHFLRKDEVSLFVVFEISKVDGSEKQRYLY